MTDKPALDALMLEFPPALVRAVIAALADDPAVLAGLTKAIDAYLSEEGWQGRWRPLEETNFRPLVQITAPVAAKAVQVWLREQVTP